MLRLDGNNVVYNNSIDLGLVEDLVNAGEGFSIALPDGSFVFIPEEDCTANEREVFAAYHEYYADTGGLRQKLPTIEELKQAKIAEIKNICNSTILAGFASSAHGGIEAHYGFKYEDQINIEALKNAIIQGLIPDGTLEYYESGQPQEPWTNAEFLALYQDAMNFKMGKIRQAKMLIAQAHEATTPEELEQIVWEG